MGKPQGGAFPKIVSAPRYVINLESNVSDQITRKPNNQKQFSISFHAYKAEQIKDSPKNADSTDVANSSSYPTHPSSIQVTRHVNMSKFSVPRSGPLSMA